MRTATVLHPHEHSFGFEHGCLRPTSSCRNDLLSPFPSKCSDQETSLVRTRRSIYRSSESMVDFKGNAGKKMNNADSASSCSSGIIDSMSHLDQRDNSEIVEEVSPPPLDKNSIEIPSTDSSKNNFISNFMDSVDNSCHRSSTEAESQQITETAESVLEDKKKVSVSCEMETFRFPREPDDAGLCTSEGDAVTVQFNHFRKVLGDFSSVRNTAETKFSHIRKIFDEFNSIHGGDGNTTGEMKFDHTRKVLDEFTVHRHSRRMSSRSVEATKLDPIMEMMMMKRSSRMRKNVNKKKTNPTPLLRDFSTGRRCRSQSVLVPYPAAYLQGWLKLERRHGLPVFEFSMSISDDVFVTAVARGERPFDWVYSFHSFAKRKKTSPRLSSTGAAVGLMQVSCFNGDSESTSLVREFVTYELGRGREGGQGCSPESSLCSTIDSEWGKEKLSSNSSPLGEESSEQSLGLEVASIVVHVPLGKKDTGKSEETMVVVTPAGSHGFPRSGTRRPSPLLERWRLGGGCDCGGWDMGCPLSVFFSNSSLLEEESAEPVHLFFQATKEGVPALALKMEEKGRYMVEFHGQLSRLQVLSVCVAILHGAAIGEGRLPPPPPRRSPLKQLFDEDN